MVGGVVGGIGGAILVGGLALVAWRLWGRRQHNRVPTDDDDIFGTSAIGNNNDSLLQEKRNSPGPSPFGRNTAQYHNPGGNLNTASNF